jgi:NADH:ubiquinone oxidoreductase subunit F (NADH-binding)
MAILSLFRLFFKVKSAGVVPTYKNTMKQRPRQLEAQVGGELYLAAKYIICQMRYTHILHSTMGRGGAGGPTPGNNKQMFYPSILSGKHLVKNNFQVSIADFG